MDCPRCQGQGLTVQMHLGIEVDACGACRGMWLDYHEMDQLEDRVMDDDPSKGTMMYAQRTSDIRCPKCQAVMTTFNYRAYDLPIDFCADGHGFWLDAGEEKRVLEMMSKRVQGLKRSASAEREWSQFLQGLAKGRGASSGGGFVRRVRGWLTGKK